MKNIKNIKEIEDVVPQYDGLAKPINTKVVEGEQKIKRENLPNEFKTIVSVEATNNTKRNVLFTSRVFTIKSGRNIEENDRGKILIHEDFAKKKMINNNSQQNPHGAFKIYCLNCVFKYMACFITFEKCKFVH